MLVPGVYDTKESRSKQDVNSYFYLPLVKTTLNAARTHKEHVNLEQSRECSEHVSVMFLECMIG